MQHDSSHRAKTLLARVRRSIWRTPWPTDDRGRIRLALNDLILHLHAPRFAKRSLRFTYSFGLGGLSIMLFVILAFTGVLLMFSYTPVPDDAYRSMIDLKSEVWLGQMIRNLHHWSGNLLLILAVLHMLRVFFTGAFHAPREFNWLLGLALVGLVALSNFTGYLLPWDQLSYWAVTIGTGMIEHIPLLGPDISRTLIGGAEVGAGTLQNFFALHVVVIPFSMMVLISFHIWRVRKDGFTIPRDVDEAPLDERRVVRVTTIPHLVSIELAVGIIVLALLLAWSAWVDAPLLEAADPNHPPNPAKAAWYFMGFQELLLHFHPAYVSFVIPALAALALFWLPYIDRDPDRDPDVTGIWFRSRRGRWLAAISAPLGVGVTAGLVLVDEYWLNLPELLHFLPVSISNGLVPLGVLLVALFAYYRLLRARGATVSEANLALFTLLFMSFVTLTVIGVYFRGENMALMYPWEV